MSDKGKMLRILCDVLDGCPLTYPCDKLWSPEGWCKEHCKPGQTECDIGCWLKYAEVMAGEALQEQDAPGTNDGDLISRQAAIDAKQEFRNPNVVRNTEARTAYDRTYANGWNDCNSAWINAIKALPPAQLEPCKDAVSRQAVIDAARKVHDIFEGEYDTRTPYGVIFDVQDAVSKLPSVTPKRKTGRWLIRDGISDAQCSECKMYFKDVYDMDNSDAFCRNCGAKMEGLKVVKDE